MYVITRMHSASPLSSARHTTALHPTTSEKTPTHTYSSIQRDRVSIDTHQRLYSSHTTRLPSFLLPLFVFSLSHSLYLLYSMQLLNTSCTSRDTSSWFSYAGASVPSSRALIVPRSIGSVMISP